MQSFQGLRPWTPGLGGRPILLIYPPAGGSVMLFTRIRPQKERAASAGLETVEVALCLEAFTRGPRWYGGLILYGGR